ncbi:Uncharacterized protein Adt_42787 [Abeliophyllum distichum]|uniref:Uncharacterized protein n=1 Tax=Abeliophyllum distichum TaxID=126358 RepID=A0ABD1PSN8_9LAMI
MPIVEKPHRLDDKGKMPAVPVDQSKTDVPPFSSKEAPTLSKAADEALFTSWEQVMTSSALRYSFVTHPTTFSIPSTNDMNALKKTVLAYTSFMDKDISRASAASKKELLARLSEDLADAFLRLTLELLTDIRLTLRGIHQEVSLLLYENLELKSKKTSIVQTVVENGSLNIAIDKAKSTLNELYFEVVIENSLLMSLKAKMRDIQVKIDDYKMRLVAKKRNTSQEIERTRALMARYLEITVDDPNIVMEEFSTIDTR